MQYFITESKTLQNPLLGVVVHSALSTFQQEIHSSTMVASGIEPMNVSSTLGSHDRGPATTQRALSNPIASHPNTCKLSFSEITSLYAAKPSQ